jgi:hypothetical protein
MKQSMFWLAAGLCCAASALGAPDMLKIGLFSRMAPGDHLPEGWELVRPSPKAAPTRYRLEADSGATVVRADADHAMAGLSRKLRVDLKRLPYLCWRWKITAPLVRADLQTRQGDDYAARLYVLFDYDPSRLPLGERLKLAALRGLFGLDIPAAAINYVWDNRHPIGTTAPNAYTDRAMMWVLRTGPSEAGRWVVETRHLAEDFRHVFGEEAPAAVGVVIASDTDNTGEQATAWFGDIYFAGDKAGCGGLGE